MGPASQLDKIRILSAASGQTRTLRPGLTAIRDIEWSPDGNSLRLTAEQKLRRPGVYEIDVKNGGVKALFEAPADQNDREAITNGRSSPGEKAIYYLSHGKNIVRRNLDDQTETTVFAAADGVLVQTFRVSPDGRRLSIKSWDVKREAFLGSILQLDSGESTELFRFEGERRVGTLFWMPDGKSLLFTRQEVEGTNAGLWQISATPPNDIKKLDVTGTDTIGALAIHPSGAKLAFTASGPWRGQIWALENFLPPLDEPKPADANAPAIRH